jgi:hypothetical protein
MSIHSYYSYNNGIIYVEIGWFYIDNKYKLIRTFFVIKTCFNGFSKKNSKSGNFNTLSTFIQIFII